MVVERRADVAHTAVTLRAAIIDLSDTVLSPDGKPAAGIANAIATLRKRGIKVAMAANRLEGPARQALETVGITVDLVVGSDTVGTKKPSPRFCTYAMERFGVNASETLYVGDSDKTDALCAVNAGVLYLSARWTNPNGLYGLPVDSPEKLLRFVFRFLLAAPQWYWVFDATDRQQRRTHVRALLPASRQAYALKQVLKFGVDLELEGLSYRAFLYRRLLTALYLDRLLADVDLWTWYPSHDGVSKEQHFHQFLEQGSRLFRDWYARDLLHRWRAAPKSAFARARGQAVRFASQVQSVHLNPQWKKRIKDKHILVVDDFCTAGFSFEWARNLLYAAGATQVSCVSFGRYHDEYEVHTLAPGQSFDPFSPCSLDDSDFVTQTVRGQVDHGAGQENRRLLAMQFQTGKPQQNAILAR